MIIKISIVIAVVIILVLALAAMKPDTFHIERTTSIKAAPDKIFPYVNDLHHWTAWSPYEKLDPNMKRTYSGSASGKGAIYEWEGNAKVGKGRMEIIESVPSSKITIKLDFIKPFEGHNVAEFTFQSKEGTTEVSWGMHGSVSLMGKIMHLFFNMDKLVGGAFERGLANLKARVEKP